MRSLLPSFAICLFLFASCNNINKEAVRSKTDSVHATEADAIKKAVDDSYKFISFKEGGEVNYSDVKKFFMPQAQLFNFRNDTLEVLPIDQFMNAYKDFIKTNNIHSFYEEELKGTTDQFGRIAQRMSTYATYINTRDSIAERGVNSFQLVKTSEGWKITSIIWDVESSKLKIPDYYLKIK